MTGSISIYYFGSQFIALPLPAEVRDRLILLIALLVSGSTLEQSDFEYDVKAYQLHWSFSEYILQMYIRNNGKPIDKLK